MSDYKTPSFIAFWWKPWMSYTLGMIGFLWATLGFFNGYFKLGLPRNVFNIHSEIFVIVIYGIPLIFIIRDKLQKIRMALLVFLLFTVWYVIPVYFPFNVNIFGVSPTNFPSFDAPGTWTNIALFILALFFGRRVKCGWMNTCVAIKETAGAPFRKFTKRGTNYFKFRHIKKFTCTFYILLFIMLFIPNSAFKSAFFYWFWTTVIMLYFGTLFLSPIFGSRIWCRWICPFFFGWANVIGFFRVTLDKEKCINCGLCENNCDFGLPLRKLAEKNEKIRTTECMGCGRCKSICPVNAINYIDVRDAIMKLISEKKASSCITSNNLNSNEENGEI